MKVLAFNQHFFRVTGIIQEDQNCVTQINTIIKNVYFIFLLGPVIFFMSGAYIYHNLNDFNAIIVPTIQSLNSVLACAMYLCLKLYAQKIQMLSQSLQELFDNGLYDKMNENSKNYLFLSQ